MTKLFARAALPVVAGALLLAGCTSTQGGTASPAGTPTAAAPSSEAGTSEAAGNANTASIADPCTLLKAGDLGSYGEFDGPDQKTLGGARVCKFQKKITNASDPQMLIGVNVRDNASAGSLNDSGRGIADRDVNGRKAREAADGEAVGCTLALPVGDSSRVDVAVTAVASSEQACQIAEAVATASVEPRLPKG